MPAFTVPPSVRARRAIVRPAVRRTLVGLLVAATALTVTTAVDRADRARDRWGTTRPVAVATRDLWPGDVVDTAAVEVRDLPEAVVPDAAGAEAPVGAVVRHPIVAGEPFASVRLAPDGLTGTAALVAEGDRAVAIPVGPGGAPPLAIGDLVDVVTVVPTGSGTYGGHTADEDSDDHSGGDSADQEPAFTLVDAATVVDVSDDAITVAVPDQDASRVAWAVANSAVVLALTGG